MSPKRLGRFGFGYIFGPKRPRRFGPSYMLKFIRNLFLFSPLIFFAYTPWTLYPAIFGRTIIFQIIVEVILVIVILANLFGRSLTGGELGIKPRRKAPISKIQAADHSIGTQSAIRSASGFVLGPKRLERFGPSYWLLGIPTEASGNYELWGRAKEIFFSPIGASLIIFTLVQFVSYLFSVDQEASFWGSMSRMDGIFSWLHMAALFFLLVAFLDKSAWSKFLKINVVIAGVLSILAVIQHFYDPVPKYIIQSGRVYATFGNPVFFALYLLFTIFLTLYFLLGVETKQTLSPKRYYERFGLNRRRVAKYFFIGMLAILQIVALFWTGSQGAIGGFLVGILVLSLIGLIRQFTTPEVAATQRIKLVRLMGIIGIVGLISFMGFFKLGLGQFVRLRELSSVEGLEARTTVWKMGLQGFKERPILGFGPSTFEYVFDKYYNPELLRHSFYETVSNKPHNIFVETLDHLGTLGFLSYLGIFTAAILVLRKIRKIDFKLAVIGFGLLVAYLGALQFSFDTTNSWYMFVVFLAYITAREQENKRTREQENSGTLYQSGGQPMDTRRASKHKNKLVFMFSCFNVLVIAAALWFGNIEAWAASVPGARSKNKYWFQKPIKWANEVRKAIDGPSPYHDEIRVIFAQDLIKWEAGGNLPMVEIQDQVSLLRSKLEESASQHPSNFQYRFTSAQIQGIEAENFDMARLGEAINSARQARDLSPRRQAAYLILGKLLLQNGDLRSAEEFANKAVELYKFAPESHWFLGIIKSAEERLDEAVAEFRLARELGYDFKPQEIIYWMSINKKRDRAEENDELRLLLQ